MPPVAALDAYQDLINWLSDYSGGDGIDRDLRDYRQAAQQAYRDLTLGNEWKTYLTRGRINLNAAQTDGSITIDVTGGANERQVTITGSTWPTWAAYGTLLVSGVRYKVDQRISNTILTLTYDSCPTVDVAAGTSYTLYQNVYPLPEDFRRLDGMHYEDGIGCLSPLQNGVADWVHMDQQTAQSGRPVVYAVGGSPDTYQYGKMSLFVYPYPDEAESIDFLYWRTARQMRYTGFGTNDRIGTVSGSAAGTTITGASTQFTSRMIGSLIRFGDATNYPEGLGGLYPYSEQRVITAVASATSLTVNEALSYAYSGVKYVITDPVDADGALLVALYRNAELQLDTMRHPERVPRKVQLYERAYREAMERDQRVVPSFGLYGSLWQSGGTLLVAAEADEDDDDDDSGEAESVPSLLFSQTEIKTVSNTVSETALTGTGDGSLTIAANSWAAGDTMTVRASGTYGTNATLPGTLTLRLKWGSPLTQTFTINLPDNQSGKTWSIESTLTRHSVGSGGTVSGGGFLLYAVTGELAPWNAEDPIADETNDSTVTQTIALTAQFSLADSDNTITCSSLTVSQETAE